MTNNQLKTTIVLLVFCIVFSSILFLGYIVYAQSNIPVVLEKPSKTIYVKDSGNIDEKQEIKTEPIFQSSPLPQEIKEMIIGVSFKNTTPIKIDDLRYLEVTYVDMSGNKKSGELIAHKDVAQDLLEIFEELYTISFPIAQMKLIDYYNASDYESMSDNNTSCFNTRTMTLDESTWSLHAYGVAIDINPIQNPYVNDEIVLPFKGKSYVNRELYTKGMIRENDPVYKAFITRGWTWGGQWETLKDYQHFEKEITLNGSE